MPIPEYRQNMYAPDFDLLTNVFKDSSFFGVTGILPILIAFIICAVVTRDVEKWKRMFFPIIIVTWALGVPLGGVGIALMLISLYFFVTDIISISVLQRIISGVTVAKEATTLKLRDKIRTATEGMDKKRAEETAKKIKGRWYGKGLFRGISNIGTGIKPTRVHKKQRELVELTHRRKLFEEKDKENRARNIAIEEEKKRESDPLRILSRKLQVQKLRADIDDFGKVKERKVKEGFPIEGEDLREYYKKLYEKTKFKKPSRRKRNRRPY